MEKWSRLFRQRLEIDPRRYARVAVPAMLAVVLIVTAALYKSHSEAREEIAAKTELLRGYSEVLAKEGELFMLKKSAEASFTELEGGLINADRPSIGAAVIQQAFKGLSSKRGISIASERALPHREEGAYLALPVEFIFMAELGTLKGVFNDMRSSPMIMGVKAVRIRPASGKDGRLEVSLVVEGAIRR